MKVLVRGAQGKAIPPIPEFLCKDRITGCNQSRDGRIGCAGGFMADDQKEITPAKHIAVTECKDFSASKLPPVYVRTVFAVQVFDQSA